MRHVFLFAPMLLLAACASPREACEARATKDLRVLNGLIAQTQANVDRGYAVEREPYVTTGFTMCVGTGKENVAVRWCPQTETRYRQRQVAIDPAEEARKLRNMRIKRDQLRREARAQVAACQRAYPES